jgi:hypothetical protein
MTTATKTINTRQRDALIIINAIRNEYARKFETEIKPKISEIYPHAVASEWVSVYALTHTHRVRHGDLDALANRKIIEIRASDGNGREARIADARYLY